MTHSKQGISGTNDILLILKKKNGIKIAPIIMII